MTPAEEIQSDGLLDVIDKLADYNVLMVRGDEFIKITNRKSLTSLMDVINKEEYKVIPDRHLVRIPVESLTTVTKTEEGRTLLIALNTLTDKYQQIINESKTVNSTLPQAMDSKLSDIYKTLKDLQVSSEKRNNNIETILAPYNELLDKHRELLNASKEREDAEQPMLSELVEQLVGINGLLGETKNNKEHIETNETQQEEINKQELSQLELDNCLKTLNELQSELAKKDEILENITKAQQKKDTQLNELETKLKNKEHALTELQITLKQQEETMSEKRNQQESTEPVGPAEHVTGIKDTLTVNGDAFKEVILLLEDSDIYRTLSRIKHVNTNALKKRNLMVKVGKSFAEMLERNRSEINKEYESLLQVSTQTNSGLVFYTLEDKKYTKNTIEQLKEQIKTDTGNRKYFIKYKPANKPVPYKIEEHTKSSLQQILTKLNKISIEYIYPVDTQLSLTEFKYYLTYIGANDTYEKELALVKELMRIIKK